MLRSEMVGAWRHGKNLFVILKPTYRQWHLHLSSTGWWMPGNEVAQRATQTDPIHDNFLHPINEKNIRVKIDLDDGQTWLYHDARTWGKWYLLPPGNEHLRWLGPDWLKEPAAAELALITAKSKKTLKDLLTDQKLTAGLGNYLACEIAHRAKLHPHTRWNDLGPEEKQRTANAVHQLIREAMENDDHRNWRVFDRAGHPCRDHPETNIQYAKDGKSAKRGSYYCPRCQERRDAAP
jgi:formamidopyrimidine-DNA glycosylase